MTRSERKHPFVSMVPSHAAPAAGPRMDEDDDEEDGDSDDYESDD